MTVKLKAMALIALTVVALFLPLESLAKWYWAKPAPTTAVRSAQETTPPSVLVDKPAPPVQPAAPAAPAPKPAPAKPPTRQKQVARVSRGQAVSNSLSVIGRSAVIGSYSQQDLYWLAKMICAEADAEPYQGQVAVGAVILHRVTSPGYPKTIKGVEFQVIDGHYQFSSVLNGWINKVEPNATSYSAAREALAGVDPSHGAMLYYNPKTSTNTWILSQPVTVVIGDHTFAK